MHDPERAAAISAARKRGGEGKANKARVKKEMIDAALTPAELNGLLGFTIKAVIAEKKAPGIGQAVAALVRVSLEAAKVTDFDERLAEVEQRLGKAS